MQKAGRANKEVEARQWKSPYGYSEASDKPIHDNARKGALKMVHRKGRRLPIKREDSH